MALRLFIIWSFIASLYLLGAQLGYAADDKASEAPQTELPLLLEKTIEEHAQKLIERHIAPEHFQLSIKVKAKSVEMPLSYFSQTLGSLIVENMQPEQLSSYIQSVEIEVLLASRFSKQVRNKLESLLFKKLILDKARGDKIIFTALGIEGGHSRSELERSLSKAESDFRELETRLEAITKERDDASRDLSLAKNEGDRLARQLRETESAAKVKQTGEGSEASIWQKQLGLLALAIFLPIALYLAALAIRSSVTGLAASIRSIAESLPALGEKLAERSTLALGQVSSSELAASQEGSLAQAAGAMSPESVHVRLVALNQELNAALDPNTEAAILQHVCRLLDSSSQIPRAVVTLELLGRAKANELYHKLGPDQQTLVAEFLRSGRHDRPKEQLMLEAGEELKTRIFAKAIGIVRANVRDDVMARVMKLKEEDLLEVARAISSNLLPRFFLYLEPAKLGALMARVHQEDPSAFPDFARPVAQMPHHETDSDADRQLIVVLDKQIGKAADELQRPYFGFYRAVVESVDDEVSELLMRQLTSAEPSLEGYLREHVITFATFLLLQTELQEEIIGSLNNRDLATLVFGLSEEAKAQIEPLISERRRLLLTEELERLQAKGSRQALGMHREIRGLIIKKILDIKGSGPLSALLKAEPRGHPLERDELKRSA